ncbi:MAG: lysostaphin resistance A-like protein [Caulobacteraceae bacterium]
MKRIGVSVLKIFAFLALWTALTAVMVMSAVALGGEGFYGIRHLRVGVEIALTFAVLIPLIVMAQFVDKRPLTTIGFGPPRVFDLLTGTIIGALIFAAPIGLLLAIGAATYAPDLGSFAADALALGLITCFFNVVTQEALVRSYVFQELWAKYGAWMATFVTTAIFVALHAAPITQGGTQGLIAGANIFLASLMLSLAYVRTGQLWLPIGIHLGWNGLQGPVLGINVTGNDLGYGHWSLFAFLGDPLLTGGAMGVEGGLVGLIGPLIGLLIVAFSFKQQPKPNFAAATK